MKTQASRQVAIALLGTSIFLAAFLLFQVQPVIGKYVLPWFGGSPGVWTTCMLFFQVMLFAGYSYAHALNRWLSTRQQIVLHCAMLMLAVLTLPITPSSDWKPVGNESPIYLILALLLCKIGLPYFLLSATGPLLQSWLGSTSICQNPYRLYSLSNFGSLLALTSFPFFIEPVLSSHQQSNIWSWTFAGFALLCSISGLILHRASHKAQPESVDEPCVSTPGWPTRMVWFALPALACVLLLGTTNQICLDTGSVPFLWIAPLTVYLISFILTFDHDRWYHRRLFILLSALSFSTLQAAKLGGLKPPLVIEVGLYLIGLFACCMVCHGEVVKLKPHPKRMTGFYLTLSAGGACGGLFVGLVAPNIFRDYFEWQLSLLACGLLFADLYLQSTPAWQTRVSPRLKVACAACILLVAGLFLSQHSNSCQQQLAMHRNFYGVLSVSRQVDPQSGEATRNIVHGRIIHGSQWESEDKLDQPTTYYTRESGVGKALAIHANDRPRRIGVVGLGAGTLAAYGQPGDLIRFYEINPVVIDFARDYFTFLRDTTASVELILGDARLMLEREAPQQYDILVLDAFSGDAIPVHLLTSEAMELYDSHLSSDGILAFHISNMYFDLTPIVEGLARNQAYHSRVILSQRNLQQSASRSLWVLLSKEPSSLSKLCESDDVPAPRGKPVLWTDDRNNLFEALR